MILSNVEIEEALRSGEITISPEPEEKQFDTSSLDLRLGGRFTQYKKELVEQPGVVTVVDPDAFNYQRLTNAYMVEINSSEDDGSIVIEPNEFVLAVTREKIHLPEESQIAARIEGRSTLARLGLAIHQTAPTIQLGFRGHLVLEIKHHGHLRLKLTPGMAICQLIFERVGEPPSGEIDTVHQGQQTP